MTTTSTVPSVDEIRERTRRLLADHPPTSMPRQEFRGHQFDAGLAWVHFPVGKGGLGVSPRAQLAVDEVLRTDGHVAGSDLWLNPIGIGMAGPTLVQYASDEILERCLRPMFTCEEVWCQLFSEPGAGSDVASLSARAVKDGDEWIVNGQKVWTTLAHVAKWGLLVARTDPEAPKHRGMTYFVLDMDQPGVDVRPLRQITGEAEFNEVFMSDARVPDSWRLGEVGKGWEVSLTTLMNERVALGGNKGGRGSGPISDIVRLWGERRTAGAVDPETDAALLDRVMKAWCNAETLRLTNQRASANRRAGQPGPEGSVAKLLSAELNKEIYEVALAIIGPEALLYPDYTLKRPDDTTIYGGDVRKSFLRSRANTIEGGTSEVMRNILGERVLGLPGEPRTDRDVPWSQVPRSG
jgi:alkylation response protein AidB-like acyl-CoA dehydrogenase